MVRHSRTSRGLAGVAAAAVTLSALSLAGTAALASDTLPWEGDSAKGPHQPYQHGYTAHDLLTWDPAADTDARLLRARVPLQERNEADASTQRDPSLPASTQLHTLAGDYGNAFFESHQSTNEFSQYLFSFWQYADIYGPWHGMPTETAPSELYDPDLDWTQKWFEFGMLNLPNPAYTNAAHANGVRSLGAIFFSDSDRGSQTFTELLVKDPDGSFPVATKLVEVAEYYGFDGYFVNQEEVSITMTAAQMADYKLFMKQLREAGLYVQWYDSVTSSGKISYQNQFNALNSPFVQDAELGRVSDSIFLNYWWNASRLTQSAAHATSLGLDPHEVVYAGVEAGMYQFNQPYDLAANLDPAGVPMNSIATLGADFVHADYANKTDDASQWEAFDRERRWWTGSSTGSEVADGTWKGISSYITERSVIDGTVFDTSFNTGHGLDYRVDGVVAQDSEWGNINVQDIPVTWQWWTESAGDPLQVDYDYGPGYVSAARFGYEPVGAFEGGSSLVLSGDLTEDTTVRLFKTDLDVVPTSAAELTYTKTSATDDSELRLALVFADDPTTVVEVPVAGSGERSSGWTTATLDLSAYAGRTVSTLGLTVASGAGSVADYQLNVGRLRLTDGAEQTPVAPTGLQVERLLAGSQEMVVSWDLADYDDVRRYDLFLDDTYLGGTYDEVVYLKDVPARSGTLRLVAVAHDGSVSQAATMALDLSSAPSEISVDATATPGELGVGWTAGGSGDTVVRVETINSDRYAAAPFVMETTVPAGTSSTAFSGVPVDGSGYLVTVRTGEGTAVAAQGNFVDATLEDYEVCSVTWDASGDAVLSRSVVADWRYMKVVEEWQETDADGEVATVQDHKTFRYTYVSQTGDQAIHGRTKRQSYVIDVKRDDSTLWVALEDYAGNTTVGTEREGWTQVPRAGEDCTPQDLGPDLAADGRSGLAPSEGERPADGVATHVVTAAVKDVFGNPVTGREVVFDLPDGLLPAADQTSRAASSATTGTTGVASLSVTSTTPGTYTVGATLDGADLLDGARAQVVFVEVPEGPTTEEPTPPVTEEPTAPGTEEPTPPVTGGPGGETTDPGGLGSGGGAPGGAATNPATPGTAAGGLAATGAQVGAVVAVAAALLAGGAVLVLRRRRSGLTTSD